MSDEAVKESRVENEGVEADDSTETVISQDTGEHLIIYEICKSGPGSPEEWQFVSFKVYEGPDRKQVAGSGCYPTIEQVNERIENGLKRRKDPKTIETYASLGFIFNPE
jgi:hypothetical protein